MAAKTLKSIGSSRVATLNTKLMASFLVLGIVPALVLGWYSLRTSAEQLHQAASFRLEDAAITDGDMIDRNLFERYGDVQAFAANPLAQGTSIDRQEIVDFLTINYGIYDLMLLVDMNGKVLTVNDVDGSGAPIDGSRLIGHDVSNEEWFRVVSSGQTPAGGTYYTDAHRSSLVSALYGREILTLPFTAPIVDDSGRIVAIWHNEASFERVVSDIMDQRVEAFAQQGLVSIETQVLRQDGVLLHDADPDTVLSFNLVDAGLEAAAGATGQRGSSGVTTEVHKRAGTVLINGYAVTDGALGFEGYQWGILVRQDEKEAAAPVAVLRKSLFVIAAIIVLVTSAAGFWLARGLSRPLKRSVAKLEEVSKGDLSVEFEVNSQDEVGQMATALNSALASIGGTMAQVDHSASDLTNSAGNLTSISQDMSTAANDTSDQATGVAAAAEQIAASSNTVARAMDQMSASVREISDSTSDAARMTAKAVEVSGLTKVRMEKLDASATDIGNVVNVITSIAEQTDLLALNATIEAARVGEAGKGFAVVANEVKALASQTSSATEEIQAKIEAIQSDAVGAVEAIAEISDLIDQVNETSTTIAGAVEEQSATTAEVSSSIQAVTDGTTSISANITAVADAAGTTTAGAAKAQEAAGHLESLAEHLSGVLVRFTLSDESRRTSTSSRSTHEVPRGPLPADQAPESDSATPRPASVAEKRALEDLPADLVEAGWR